MEEGERKREEEEGEKSILGWGDQMKVVIRRWILFKDWEKIILIIS